MNTPSCETRSIIFYLNFNIMWIARDESGAVYLYKHKPIRLIRHFVSYNGERGEDDIYLGEKETYPEITWENSPKQVELKIID